MSHKIDGLNGLAGVVSTPGLQVSTRRSSSKDSVSAASEVAPVQLSQDARQLHDLQAAASSAPEADNPRVEAIRAALANGTYKVDPEQIASKLLSIEPHLPK
jgi:negative regulator of flagellin synthesis FlgM